MSDISNEKYNPRKVAEKLVQRIKSDAMKPGFPSPTQEDIEKVSPGLVIWNLFYGNDYKFSSRELDEVLKILYEK